MTLIIICALELSNIFGVPFINFKGNYQLYNDKTIQHLKTTADTKKQILENWINEQHGDLMLLHELTTIQKGIQKIKQLNASSKNYATNIKKTNAETGMSVQLSKFIKFHRTFTQIQIINTRTGFIAASTNTKNIGEKASKRTMAIIKHTPHFSIIMQKEKRGVNLFALNFIMHVGTKANYTFQHNSHIIMISTVDPQNFIAPLLHNVEGHGKTGEAVIVDTNQTLIFPTKFPAINGKALIPLTSKIETMPAKLAAAGEEGLFESVDYRGVPVLTAFRHLRLSPTLHWGMVVKTDKAEIFAPLFKSLYFTSIVAIMLALIALLIIWILAGKIVAPIKQMSNVAKRIQNNDFSERATISTQDEIGLLATVFNNMIDRIQDWKTTLEKTVAERTKSLEFSNDFLNIINEINQSIVQERNRGQLLKNVCDIFTKNIYFNKAWALTFNKYGKTLEHAENNIDKDKFHEFINWLDEGNIPNCISKMESNTQLFQFNEIAKDEHHRPLLSICHDGHFIVSRLIVNQVNIGLLVVSFAEERAEATNELKLIKTLSNNIAFALNNIRDEQKLKNALTELTKNKKELQSKLAEMIQMLSTVVDMKDPFTADHQKNVAKLAVAIGKELNLSDMQIETLRISGLLHDIGKIQVPHDILTYPGKLNKTQFELIKTHSQKSYEILNAIESLKPIAKIALQHHERMDGSGYPKGIKSDEILLEAKILNVADVVEAMTAHRPYRAALKIEDALNEITKNKNILYDEKIVNACINLFKQKNFTFDRSLS